MDRRQKLQSLLEGIMGSENVYYQPPSSHKMSYPCIVYDRNLDRTQHASNLPYLQTDRYQVTVIDRKADSNFPRVVARLPLTRLASRFVKDNLHHDVFDIYF